MLKNYFILIKNLGNGHILTETTDGQLENLEKLTSDLEFSQIEQKVLDGLKIGNEALKKVHEILTIDEVERILDETNEGVEKQREIDRAINQYADAALTDEDEEQVLAELDELLDADERNKTTAAADDTKPADDINLPEVPTDELPSEDRTAEKTEKKRKIQDRPIALEA